MERYKIILAYDGSPFQGFQRQGQHLDGVRTVQGVVESALRKIGWLGDSLLAGGRTDTGVHATGQVITFDLAWKHGADSLLKALNAQLPPEVAVISVETVPPQFHPRFDAIARTYEYFIYAQAMRNPLRERYAWRVWPSLDVATLEQAASLLIGKHDFAAFGTPPRANGSTVRTVKQARWQKTGDQLTFYVTADAFLYHMVRRMVFLQVVAAHGRLDMAVLAQAVEDPARNKAHLKPGLAPPHGLVLNQIHYLPGWYRPRINSEDQQDRSM